LMVATPNSLPCCDSPGWSHPRGPRDEDFPRSPPQGGRQDLTEVARDGEGHGDDRALRGGVGDLSDLTVVGGHRRGAEAALCGRQAVAPGQFPAPFRPRIRIRQKPAKAERAAGLRKGLPIKIGIIGAAMDLWRIPPSPAPRHSRRNLPPRPTIMPDRHRVRIRRSPPWMTNSAPTG